MQIVMYFLSLFLVTASLIIFVTIGGFFSSYFYKLIGDSTSWENGFDSLNPLNHIDLFNILIFMITGWFLGMKRPPFDNDFKMNQFIDVCKMILYIIGPGLFHIIIAAIILFLGVLCFSIPFFQLAIKTSLRANSYFIFDIVSILKINGIKLLFATFCLYSISINLILALLNFIFAFIDILFKRYFVYMMADMKFIFLFYVAIFLFVAFFSGYITYFFWKIIVLPLYLLY